MTMTELEKLEAGVPYDFTDEEVNARKLDALTACQKLNSISPIEKKKRQEAVRELLGSAG